MDDEEAPHAVRAKVDNEAKVVGVEAGLSEAELESYRTGLALLRESVASLSVQEW